VQQEEAMTSNRNPFRSLLCMFPLSVAACSLITENKPVPPAIGHNPSLEELTMNTYVLPRRALEAIDARVVRVVEELDEQHRFEDVTVVMRWRDRPNDCRWETYRYHLTPEGLRKMGMVDHGAVDCRDPAVSKMTIAASPGGGAPNGTASPTFCAQAVDQTMNAFCKSRPAHPPAGYANLVKQQRATLAASCGDGTSAIRTLAPLDACIAALDAPP
jgi:hypothetical protein